MWDWVHDHGWLLGSVSVATLVLGAVLTPLFLAEIPADYFVREKPPEGSFRRRHPVIRWGLRGLKILFGAVLLVAGVAMLFLPGQGILTVLAGLALLEFPGKRRLELLIVRQKPVRRAIDWVRARARKPPLQLPPETKTRPKVPHGR